MSSNNLTATNRQNAKRVNNKVKLLISLVLRTAPGILISLLLTTVAFGQLPAYTNNTHDLSLRGSGRVNSSTLGMEFNMPLGGYPGRGINLPINLSYSSKVWRIEYSSMDPGNQNRPCSATSVPAYSENSASGWTTNAAIPHLDLTGGMMAYNSFGQVYDSDYGISCDPGSNPSPPPLYYIRRVTFVLPGGESHELRLDNTPAGAPSGTTWDGTYYAVDSSNIKYIRNSTTGVYKVLMPDGSFYDLNSSGTATQYTDRNGNYITYHAADMTYPNGYITDTLGKNIAIPLAPHAPASAGTQNYSMPSITGTVNYTLHWKQLKGSTAADSGLTNFSDPLMYIADNTIGSGGHITYRDAGTFLFASEPLENRIVGLTQFHNPIVLTEIDTPTGEKYKFSYNVFGELDKIEYPTGGKEVFEYNPVEPVSQMDPPYAQGNRGVTNRKVYETAGSGTYSEWQYSTPSSGGVHIINPDNTKIVTYTQGGSTNNTYGFDNVLSGMPYREMTFSSTGQIQAQKITYWTKSTGEWHPHVLREDSIIYDSSGNGLSSTATYDYEGDLSYKETPVLVNKTTAYDFETTSAGSISYSNLPSASIPALPSAPSTPVKIAESTYLINDPAYSSTASYYTAQNMVGLVTASVIKNGSGTTVLSKTLTEYDKVSSYPIISDASSETGWQDPGHNYRGNPTTASVWDSTKGAVTSSGNFISTHAQFNNFGSLRKIWDALGNMTETEYDSPSDQNKFAFPTKVTSAVPDPNPSSNPDGLAHGSSTAFVSSATFDPTTGLPQTSIDINGIVTEMEYDHNTLRPTVTTVAPGTANEVQTIYEYGVPDSTTGVYSSDQRFVKVKSQLDATNWKEAYSWVDGLGRSIKSKAVDSRGDVYAETEYDTMGRVKRSTNPYKTGETKQWTTPTYDDFGRTVQVTSPDSTHVDISYGVSTSGVIGITKTVTDQAGKKRKGISDVLGRMIRVIEDPTGQNLATDYVFDTLGNLRKTTQGSQNRYFSYDSLGRLLRAKQVEQDVNSALALSTADPITSNNSWTVKYVYDDNGNITSTTDALNNSVSAAYDHLNRLIYRNYSDPNTPDVALFYDGKYRDASNIEHTATGGVNGKATGIKSSVSITNITGFDDVGRPVASQQITDGTTYDFDYTYNLSGALIEETYPSTRKVKYTLDQDGALSMVQSKKNSSAGYFAYAMGFDYNSNGSLKKMRLGNGHWETYSYNERQQVTQIGLGTTDTTQDLLNLQFTYNTSGNHDNNGAMLSQTITVPNSAGSSTNAFSATQTYTYDSLNRLYSAEEKVSSSTTWKQTFDYDIYGNRRFDTSSGNTTTLGSCTTAICNPTISTSTNRLSSTGYAYDANGSLTQDALGQRFTYDSEGRQNAFFTASNSTTIPDATYYYDGNGQRVKKISSTEITVFVYDAGGQQVAEYSTDLADTPQVSYLTSDHLGSARIITNERGAVTKRQDFAAFGDEITGSLTSQRNRLDYTGSKEIRQDYTGYQKDTESELEYAQARYYNTQHGRFTSVDPLPASATIRDPQTFNRYSYALNSPYKFSDPLGLLPYLSVGACGTGCRNSDNSVDGTAFHGQDTSMIANMIGVLNLAQAVAQALSTVQANDWSPGGSNIGWGETSKIKTALVDILNNGNDAARSAVAFVINSGIQIDVLPQAQVSNNASAETKINDIAGLNKAIAAGSLTQSQALKSITIVLAREEFSNSVSANAAIQGNIIHEATHSIIFATILSSLATGNPKKYQNETIANDEVRAAKAAASYVAFRGGEFATFGKAINYIDSSGNLNEATIAAQGTSAKTKAALNKVYTVQDKLKSYGIKWKQ